MSGTAYLNGIKDRDRSFTRGNATVTRRRVNVHIHVRVKDAGAIENAKLHPRPDKRTTAVLFAPVVAGD